MTDTNTMGETKGLYAVGHAMLVDDSRECAWAERFIKKAPDVKHLLGNFIQASTETAANYNSNGHSWKYDDDLRYAVDNIPGRPLNLNHGPRKIGAMTATEFVWPEDQTAAPIVEAAAVVWSYYEPDLMPAIELAHKEGSLFFSMECTPQSLTCMGSESDPGCGETYPYEGRTSPNYCAHLNKPRARKTLNKGFFPGAALIVPPTRPGWTNASIKEISHLIEAYPLEAEEAYGEIAAAAPHLSPLEWEHAMAFFLASTKA